MEQLEKLIKDGYISKRKHPTKDLWIYNYTNKTQWEKHWNDWTLRCRGLIMDEKYNIIARPFEKFFNLGEIDHDIPNLPFEVTEKMDGSLIIWFSRGLNRLENFENKIYNV